MSEPSSCLNGLSPFVKGASSVRERNRKAARESGEAVHRLRDGLLRIPGVGKVEIFGIQDERIFVELANAKLATLGIDQSTIIQALSQSSLRSSSPAAGNRWRKLASTAA